MSTGDLKISTEPASAQDRRLSTEAAAAGDRRISAEAAAADERRISAEAAAADERRISAEAAAADERRISAEAAAADERRISAEAAAADERRISAEAAAADERRISKEAPPPLTAGGTTQRRERAQRSGTAVILAVVLVLPLVAAELWTGYRLAPSSLALTVISGLEQPLSVRSTIAPWAMALAIGWFAIAYWQRTLTLWEAALVLLGGTAVLLRAGNAWVDALALILPLGRQLRLLSPRPAILVAVAALGLAATAYALVATRPPALPPDAIKAAVTSTTNGSMFADWRWAPELQQREGTSRHVLAAGGLGAENDSFWLDYDRIVQGHERWSDILQQMNATVIVLDSKDQAFAAAALVRESPAWHITYDAEGVLVAEKRTQ